KKVVVINDVAGSTNNSSVDFDLPSKVEPLEEVEITVKGKYTGTTGFRMWLGSGHDKSFQNNIKTFSADELKAEEEFAVTVTAANECGQHNNLGAGGTTPATKLSVKAPKGQDLIDGLTIESITVNYVDRTPDIKLDLNNYKVENGKPEITCKNNVLDLSCNQYEGISFVNPADSDMMGNYKYVTVTYTSSEELGDLRVYVTDGEGKFDDNKYTKLSANKTEKTLEARMSANGKASANGLKIFNYGSKVRISIKSVVFSHKKPVRALDPSATALPYYKVDFEKDVRYEKNGTGANDASQTMDGEVAKITFGAYKGLFYFLPDTDEIYKSNFKYLYITYESTVENTDKNGVSVYLPTISDLEESITIFNDNQKEQSLKLTTDKTVAEYSSDVAMRAVQIFAFGGSVTGELNIKSIIFSENKIGIDDDGNLTFDENGNPLPPSNSN
ncbi:MAG: hypothetical protein K2K09_02195, partial [Lachnospiraceae bacterium]|nr:hypothetical protein [Lachnospiraceae bacterium]